MALEALNKITIEFKQRKLGNFLFKSPNKQYLINNTERDLNTQLQENNYKILEHFTFHFDLDHYVLYQDERYKDNDKEGWDKKPFEYIAKYSKFIKRIQYNTVKFIQYIIIDIDNFDIYKYREHNIPEPNLIIKNDKKVGGAHLFYILDRPIFQNKKSQYYVDMWREIFKKFTYASGGDIEANGHIGKNYLNDWLFCHEVIEVEPYSLKNLYEVAKSIKKPIKPIDWKNKFTELKAKTKPTQRTIKKLDTEIGSRNVDIFNTLRLYAYSVVKSGNNASSLELMLTIEGKRLNSTIKEPLSNKEIEKTIRSICKYCLKNERAIIQSKDKGVMELDKNLTIKKKQALGANYTNEQQINKTKLKIQKAVIDMKEQGLKINGSSVAKYTKIHRNTISKYKELLT